MFDLFKSRAEAVSAEVHRFATTGDALAFVLDLARREGVADAPGAWAVWAPGPLASAFDRAAVAGRLPGLRFDVTRDLAAGARVGISEMRWGLADTGTVAQDASAVEERLVSTLPPLHVAWLPTGALLPDLPALLERIDPAHMAYVTLITGPSRTADIERVLTIGVHGPERLVIVCVDDLGEAA